jgi:hypothetical protein
MFIKQVITFCLKSICFTLIFWGIWLGVIRQITNPPQSNSSSTQDVQAKSQIDAYNNQVARANHQLDVVEEQQHRMEKYLTAQEENTKRFDAVLKVWEKQTGLRK